MAWRSLSDEVRWGFIPCPFSTFAARNTSFGELMYASQMSVQKRTKASASLSWYYGRDPCAELCPTPFSSIDDVMTWVCWDDVNKTTLNKI